MILFCRLYQYVNIPKRQLKQDRLWTNNNCESINHIDFEPKPLPKLAKDLHDVVRVHFLDMRRALYGMVQGIMSYVDCAENIVCQLRPGIKRLAAKLYQTTRPKICRAKPLY